MPEKLPIISGKDCITALQKVGFIFSSQKGSHVKLRKDGLSVIVPSHKTLKRGTLRSIIRQAGLTVDQFVELLKE